MSNATIQEQHTTGLGGTAAAAIMGYSRFKTRYDVYAECLGIKPDTETSDAMRVGTHNEPLIRDWYERESGRKGAPQFLRHPTIPWMLGNLDWLADDKKTFAEFKVAGLHSWRDWGDPERGQVPQEYYFQGLHYALLTGIRQWDFVVLIGTEFRRYPQSWNESLAGRLYEAERRFWVEHVETKTPPPIDHSDSCACLMGRLYPSDKQDVRMVETSEEAAALAHLADCKRNREAEEGNYQEACNHVKAMLKDGAGLKSDACQVTWKANKKGTRVFRVTLKEESE